MSGHTKAPWAIVQFGTTDKWAIGPDVSTRVCDAYGIDNARLIASAPELLDALRFIMAFYEPGQTYLDTNAWQQAESNARAAIAKAEGQS